MTSRERLIRVLERRAPDRLPVTTHHLMASFLDRYLHGMSSNEFFDRFGMDAVHWTLPLKGGRANKLLEIDWIDTPNCQLTEEAVPLSASEAKKNVHIRFPGLFGEARLYVNGRLVAYRSQAPMWWNNDYAFHWDVALAGTLQADDNVIVVRNRIQHHVGGMFHRPFLYEPTGK